MKKFLIAQSILLLIGTIFAWSTVANDYVRFTNGMAANPMTTPCFYGAIGFLIAYIYSLYIFFLKDERQKKHEKILVIFLIAGTLFGWGNFIWELCKFYIFKGSKTSCSGYIVSSPFVTPCFYGSMLYLLSLITSIVTLRKIRKSKINKNTN